MTDLSQIRNAFSLLLKEMSARGLPYYGFLFCGFMKDARGNLNLLECNCRLGDPESQVILPGLTAEFFHDLVRVAQLKKFSDGGIPGREFKSDGQRRVFVVAAAPEYPQTQIPMRSVILGEGNLFPYSITREGKSKGGRIVGALGEGASFSEARSRAYSAVEKISLSGNVKPHFRRDIALEFLESP